jgi:hypothetical protein
VRATLSEVARIELRWRDPIPLMTEIIILLCGGDKSTQAKDIKAAKQLAAQWRD